MPHVGGSSVDAAVVQADHAAYRSLGADALPGVRTVVDGRRVLDASRFDGVTVVAIGAVV
ncbi:MAG: hypothetical protein INR72_19350 [Williamsia herbipolensis]|nr:hypothetical protein [Williamsia herbipolensis]